MGSRTMYAVLEETARTRGNAPALHQPTGKGHYQTYTWREYKRAAQEIACGLRQLGIGKGDTVALHSETRAEFYLADLGVLANGSIAAALYTTYPFPDQAKNVRASHAKAVFMEDPKCMQALMDAAGHDPLTGLHWIVLTGESEGALTLEQLRAKGRAALKQDPQAFEKIRAEVRADDPAILYLTSGATGEPKMGLVTHGALTSNIDMGPQILTLGPTDCTIAFLPSAHIAQRVVIELLPIREGGCIWFSEGLSKLPQELRTIRPTFFLAPPRVWERIYSTVAAEIRKRPAAVRRLFYTAIGLGSEASRRKQQGKPVPGWMRTSLRIFDRLVFSKIRERLGGRMRLAASGAAPLSKDLAEFYGAIGMALVEGYGLTEGGVALLNPFDRPKAGSIGKLLPGIEGRIEEDGELMLRGASLFSGYYKDPEATSAVLRDGWLATGDIAEVDADGYYYIT